MSARDEEDARVAEQDRRIAALLADAEAACGPVAWPRVEALVGALVDLYGAGLHRLVTLARASATDRDGLDEALASDAVVSSLLLVHDLHPIGLDRRLARALDRVHAEVPHAAPLEVVDTTDGVVLLRPSSTGAPLPTTAAVARAIEREAPELAGVRIDGGTQNDVGLVPVERLVRGGAR